MTVLPEGRAFAWRDDGPRPALVNGTVTLACVERPIAIDALDRPLDLLKLARQRARVNDRCIGEQGGDDLLRVGIDADMELTPAAAIILAVGADFPFAFTKDFESRRIE